ncbi:type II toxin-antitoxin system YoeB family toxin [Rikenella microfusus]|uniref:type II toxin-antitoxin system YoeB family toxin n=1 Tax=Rikenella microfusus TaxID=28139 RepID=UPI003463AD04
MRERPDTGFGRPEPLKYGKRGYWSRQITVKHRLVYQIREEEITVLIVQAFGRYMDK